ncbi:MAG: GMC family oxidoreductase [Burkholderiaceae bacterium]
MLAPNLSAVADGRRTYDVCLVGAGPAGITLAELLGQRGLSVLLLEAGPMEYSVESQALYEGDIFGKLSFPMSVARLRLFGGTSNHWGGWSRRLDAHDFENKIPGVDGAWPIKRSDLDPYAKLSGEILDLKPVPDDQPLDENLTYIHFAYSPPTNFAVKYRESLEKSPNVTVVTQAALINVTEQSGQITGLIVRGADNRDVTITARRYVLCAGGIENSRLLLWFNATNHNRIVKDPTALGRYWMEHPHFTLGEALLNTKQVPWTFDQKSTAYISPTTRAIHERHVLNCALRLHPMHYEGTKALVADLACVAPDTAQWALSKLKYKLVCGTQIRANWEQAPLPWNRVTLGTARDALGIPRVDLHWEYGDIERNTARRVFQMFGEYLVHNNMGRARMLPWLAGDGDFPEDDEIRGNHHMGGTRMSTDTQRGVVDTDLRIHGLSNFYVCGSSVFPSAGEANPTWTIIQLACRLADHLTRPDAAGVLDAKSSGTASTSTVAPRPVSTASTPRS